MKNILSFLGKLFVAIFNRPLVVHNTGVNPDTRPPEEKQKDYLHEERAIAAPVNPFGNTKINEAPYQKENQANTSQCVPHAQTLALGIEFKNDVNFFVRLSKSFIYRLRVNFRGEGSVPSDIAFKLSTLGTPLYTTLPDVATEEEANAVVLTPQMFTEADIYRGKEFYSIKNFNSIDSLAAVAQAGHGVAICIFASFREWVQLYPQTYDNVTPDTATVRHSVMIIPNSGFTENGVRYLTVQDSAPFQGLYIHHLSEEFIAKRVYNALYFDTVKMTPFQGKKPQHTFTKVLKYNDRGDEVKALQTMLIYEGLLPSDCCTGFFAGRTLAGVKAFQNKYADKILIPLGLNAPTEVFGSSSIAQANRLYAQVS